MKTLLRPWMTLRTLRHGSFSAHRQRGFTIIELMTAVAIAGIIASVWVGLTFTSTGDARDSRRKTDLSMVQAALEAFAQVNDSYPSTGGTWYSSEPGDNVNNGPLDNGVWIPGLVPNFISKLPRDPKGGGGNGALNGTCTSRKKAYLYVSTNGRGYKLVSRCGQDVFPLSATDQYFDPVRSDFGWMVCRGSDCAL